MSTDAPKNFWRITGPLLAAGLLIIGGIASLVAQFAFQNAPADPDDWRRASELTVELSERTDAVRVHPSWTEAPLPHLMPLGNLMNRQHYPLLEDLYGVERVLILTEARRRRQALDRLPFQAEPDEIHDFGSVELLAVPIPPAMQIRADLAGVLRNATAFYGDEDGSRTPCRNWSRRDNAWLCDGRNRDAMVRPVLLEMEDDPRRCIQAYPPSGDRFLAVEATMKKTSDVLRVRAGLDRRSARLQRGGDVIYRIFLDDELVEERLLDGHNTHWTPHDFDTSDREEGPLDLRIEVESVDHRPHHRRFCFNAWPMTAEQLQKSNR